MACDSSAQNLGTQWPRNPATSAIGTPHLRSSTATVWFALDRRD